MNYAKIKFVDVANGDGVRISVYVCGCRNHCKGCFNPETWNFDYGEPWNTTVEKQIYFQLEKQYVNGISILGGDPFEPENAETLLPFLRTVHKMFPQKPTWVYTGYTWEYILKKKNLKGLLHFIDVLVDGPFIENLKDLNLRFRGSSNQRIIDVQRSLIEGKIVEVDYAEEK